MKRFFVRSLARGRCDLHRHGSRHDICRLLPALFLAALGAPIAALGAPSQPRTASEALPPRPQPQVVWEVVRGADPVVGRVIVSGGIGQRPKPQALRFGLRGAGGFAGAVDVALQAVDPDNRPMAGPDGQPWRATFALDVPADGRLVLTEIPFSAPTIGWWRLRAELSSGTARFTAEGDLAFVPPPHTGPRPHSFFGSNNAPVRPGQGGEMTQAIGMKVSRRQVPGIVPLKWDDLPPPSDRPLPLDMHRIGADFDGARTLGIVPMIVPGYSFKALGSDHGNMLHGNAINLSTSGCTPLRRSFWPQESVVSAFAFADGRGSKRVDPKDNKRSCPGIGESDFKPTSIRGISAVRQKSHAAIPSSPAIPAGTSRQAQP